MLQTISRDTSTNGSVIIRLNITQTASRCTIRKNKIKCEVKGEAEEKETERKHPLLHETMDPSMMQLDEMIHKVKIEQIS